MYIIVFKTISKIDSNSRPSKTIVKDEKLTVQGKQYTHLLLYLRTIRHSTLWNAENICLNQSKCRALLNVITKWWFHSYSVDFDNYFAFLGNNVHLFCKTSHSTTVICSVRKVVRITRFSGRTDSDSQTHSLTDGQTRIQKASGTVFQP